MNKAPQHFRAGVGAVIVDSSERVLAFERSDVPGSWQFPQGGLQEEEEPQRGVLREIQEETGLSKEGLKLLDRYPEPLAYELPADARSKKTGRGQVQYWFLFELVVSDEQIELGDSGEFRAFRWMSWDEILQVVVPFRKLVYERLAQRFGAREHEE